jgi:hypothetical protein
MQGMGEAYSELSKACVDAHKVSAKDRILTTFYLVEFFGEVFGELNEKGYIFKERVIKLDVMSEKLINEYQGMVRDYYRKKNQEEKKVVILREDKPNPNIPTIGLRCVEPYLEGDDLTMSLKKHLSNTLVRKFKFDLTYTESGKKSEQLQDLCLSRTTVQTYDYFPFCLSRMEVIPGGKRESKFTPAQKSILDMKTRITSLRDVLQLVQKDESKIQKMQNLMTGALTPRFYLYIYIYCCFRNKSRSYGYFSLFC